MRVPVAFALGLACLPILVIEPRLSPLMLFNETFKAYNSFILLAVPFFLLTANLMNVGGITDRLVRLSRAMVGIFRGARADQRDFVGVLRGHLGLFDRVKTVGTFLSGWSCRLSGLRMASTRRYFRMRGRR